MTKIFSRRLIDVEIRKGFINIPRQGIELMPDQKTRIKVRLEGEEKAKELTYSVDDKRVYGLTAWLRKHDAKVQDEITIRKQNDLFEFMFKKYEKSRSEAEARRLIDFSGLSSTDKGNIVEDRVKDLIVLQGQGLFSVYKPVTDTEGIDLIVVKSGVFQPIFLQVKSRYTLTKQGSFLVDVRVKTFKPHHAYFVVGAYFNPERLEIDDYILLIPTLEIGDIVRAVGEKYRITTHLNPKSKSKWAKFIIRKSELSSKLLGKFEEMSRYIK